MPRQPSEQPTEVELAILNVLWERGPSSVGQVHEALKASRDTVYSTTLKMIQVMFGKGLLTRNESQRPRIYQPAKPKKQTQSQLVDHLIQKAFGGSVRKMVLSAVESKSIRPEEVTEIHQLLKQIGKGEKYES